MFSQRERLAEVFARAMRAGQRRDGMGNSGFGRGAGETSPSFISQDSQERLWAAQNKALDSLSLINNAIFSLGGGSFFPPKSGPGYEDWGDWDWIEYPNEARAALFAFESKQAEREAPKWHWLEDTLFPRLAGTKCVVA